MVQYGTGQIRDSARRDTNKQTPNKALWTLASARRYWGCVYTTTIENDLRLHDNEVGPKRNEIVAFTTIVYTTTPENDT